MIFPDVDLKVWSERYNLTPKILKCKCGKEVTTTVPIAIKGYRGLKAPPHNCNHKFEPVLLAPHGEEKKEFWDNFRFGE